MIHINLLPPDELRSIEFRQKKLPVVPYLLGVFFILLILWVCFIISITAHTLKVSQKVSQLKSLAAQKSEVDDLWAEVNNVLAQKQKACAYAVSRPIEWARVLNIISDYTAAGVWYSDMVVELKDGVWLLTLSGFAKQTSAQSMFKDVGTVITSIKDAIDADLLKPVASAKDLKKERIEVSTTAKRKKADTIELIEFVASFKISI